MKESGVDKGGCLPVRGAGLARMVVAVVKNDVGWGRGGAEGYPEFGLKPRIVTGRGLGP